MKAKSNSVMLILASAAAAAMAAFMIWAFNQPGTLGLYRWGYHVPFLVLFALGIAPLVFVLVLRKTMERNEKKWPVLRKAGLALPLLSLVIGSAAALFFLASAYGEAPNKLRPALVDPAVGFPVRTDSNGAPSFRVALSSDPHYGREASDAAARSAILRLSQAEYSAGQLDAFIDLGDTVEMGMDPGDWREALESITRDAPTLPFIALMGNHDAMIGGVFRWRAAFAAGKGKRGIPEGGLSASSWRMDEGPVHFIALDLLWGPEGFGRKEQAWLASQIASIPDNEYIVVLSHCFFYSSGYTDSDTGKPWYDHAAMLEKVAPLLAGKVDLVVSGHNHYMEWIETGGTAWAVVGAMGGKPDPIPTYMSPGSVWFSQGVFGRLVLDLGAEGLVCEFQDQTGKSLFARTLASSR